MANPKSPFLGKRRMHPFIHLSIGFWLYTAFQCRSSMSSNCLVFHTSGGISSSPAAFLFLIFLSTESSSSWVNGPSLMSNCLLIILVIGSCITFWVFPSKFLKCCFHRSIYNITNSINPSSEFVQKSHGNTIVCKFLQGIWFHTQQEDEANTSSWWSLQRNRYSYNDAL